MSRATTKPKPLPANLPPLPEPPAGFSGWEYMGMGYKAAHGSPFAACVSVGEPRWTLLPGGRCDGDILHRLHYAVAVKRPAKASAAKKTKATIRKSRKVEPKPERKGRVVADFFHVTPGGGLYEDKGLAEAVSGPNANEVRPVFVLPADAASVERMVEQVARDKSLRHHANEGYWKNHEAEARADLGAIGIAATGEGARK